MKERLVVSIVVGATTGLVVLLGIVAAVVKSTAGADRKWHLGTTISSKCQLLLPYSRGGQVGRVADLGRLQQPLRRRREQQGALVPRHRHHAVLGERNGHQGVH